MPSKTKKVSKSRHLSHAHPHSKQRPKHFAKVYWPYIPLIALVLTGFFGGVGLKPFIASSAPSVLAYSTEMSRSGLLNATNSERSKAGVGSLTINGQLNSAAQAKAEDMVARDYWSHNTPDGKAPWVFIDNTGYKYQKAGENLAYGFATSNETIVGWMNSQTHRANMLDVAFLEVGFGFANSPNFVGNGEQTVVVAMYAKPQVAAAPPQQQTPPPAAPANNTPAPSQNTPAETPAETVPEPVETEPVSQELTTDNPVQASEPDSTNITRLQNLTGGRAPWSAIALSVGTAAIVGFWLFKHALIVRKALVTGEQFVMHHPAVDITVAVVVAVAIVLSRSAGVIR